MKAFGQRCWATCKLHELLNSLSMEKCDVLRADTVPNQLNPLVPVVLGLRTEDMVPEPQTL